jgi:hypothetical protein
MTSMIESDSDVVCLNQNIRSCCGCVKSRLPGGGGEHAAAQETWRQAWSELELFLKEQPENYGNLALTNMGLGDQTSDSNGFAQPLDFSRITPEKRPLAAHRRKRLTRREECLRRIPIAVRCAVEALSEGNQIIFTEIVEIRTLRKVEKPTENNADQGDQFISADEAREWRREQDENEARIRR